MLLVLQTVREPKNILQILREMTRRHQLGALQGFKEIGEDIDGGKWSLSKRLTVTRVVDRETGEIPSRGRLVMRNSYYLILCLLSAIPLIEWATLSLVVTVMFIDLIVMVATPDSRRIGDFIANTQVIPVQAN